MQEATPESDSALRVAQSASGLVWAAVFFALTMVVTELFLWALQGWTRDVVTLSTLAVLPAALAVSFVLPRQNGAEALEGLGLASGRRGLFAGLGMGFVAITAAGGGLLAGGWASVETGEPTRPALFLFALTAGVAGEELKFRGYGFQQLARALTPMGAAFATATVFGVLHYQNPGATPLAAFNTALFGLLFGLALVRRRSLWMSFGIHLTWNLSLALLGAKISGLTIRLTALEVVPAGSELWSGGAYGPEASPVVTLVVSGLIAVVWRQPEANRERRLVWDEDDSGHRDIGASGAADLR